MHIIPVIDLMNCQAVHAVKGRRNDYKPIESILCKSSDPLEVAAAFYNKLGLNEIYIADLDAIQTGSLKKHSRIIENLASLENLDIILDAGISDMEGVSFWVERGVTKVVIGSETLASLEALEDIAETADTHRIVFSLDCRNGKILSKCIELAAISPMAALDRIQASGFREIILLDLALVGSGHGINRSFTEEACMKYPAVHFLAGGGITGIEELQKLRSIGLYGALIATVLHQGIVGIEHLLDLNS